MEHQRFCEVRTLEAENNRYAVFATADVEAGDEICCELPFVACPTALTAAAVNKHCELCLSGIETPEAYVGRICQNSEWYSGFLSSVTQEVPPENHEVVWCESGCGAVYCSANCRKVAWNDFHRKICPGTDTKKVSKLDELRNIWRGLQAQIPFKMFDIGLILRIIGSGSYEEFLQLIIKLDQGRSAIPVLAETETRDFVAKVFGPAYLIVVGLLQEFFVMQGMTVISEVDGTRLMSPEIRLGVIHVLLVASVEVQGSAITRFTDLIKERYASGLRNFQMQEAFLSIQKLSAKLEFGEETAKEFGHSGFGIFKSLFNLRRCDELQNADVSMTGNKALLLVSAIKGIQKGEEIVIGNLPQYIISHWKASLNPENSELEETSSSSDETDLMDVDMEINRHHDQEENRGYGRRRRFQAISHTPASSQGNISAMESETDEPPSRRRRIDNARIRHNYTAATLKTEDGMTLALREVIDTYFDLKADYGPESKVFPAFVSRRVGVEIDHRLKPMLGKVMKAFNFKNIKKTAYDENGRSVGQKHHFSGIIPKPGVEIKCGYLGAGRLSL